MRQSIFLVITKWWCNCIDLCFEIMARPWNEEELQYRRIICAIFGQDWKLPRSFSKINQDNIPQTFKGLREWLTSYTYYWLNSDFVGRNMTPAWPDGTVEFLEEHISEMLTVPPISGMTESGIKAFRLMHEVDDNYVPKRQLAEKLGVEKSGLYLQLWQCQHRLRQHRNTKELEPFAFRHISPNPDQIISEWKRYKQELAWEEAMEAGTVPVDILDRSVEELELSVRTYNCLKIANLYTISDILKISEGELLQQRNFGRKSLNELKDVLEATHPLLKIGMLKRNG